MFLFAFPSIMISAYSSQPAASKIPGGPFPIILPNTPTQKGCYKYVASQKGWITETCHVNIPLPKLTEGGSSGVTGEASTSSIGYGYVAVYPNFVYGEKDSGVGGGAFSVQANSNGFVTSPGGDTMWVQFTVQNDPGFKGPYPDQDLFCIWTVDVTTQDYNNDCENISLISIRGTSYLPTPSPNTLDYMYGAATNSQTYGDMLSAQFCLNGRTNCWYINTNDIGLAGRWTGLTGTILGYGGGSKATFSNSAYGGKPLFLVETGIYQPTKPSTSGEEKVGTLETSNLKYASTGGTPSCSGGWCTTFISSN